MMRCAVEGTRAFDFEREFDGGELGSTLSGTSSSSASLHQPQRVKRKVAGLVDLHGEDISFRTGAGAFFNHLDILDALAAFDAEVCRAKPSAPRGLTKWTFS